LLYLFGVLAKSYADTPIGIPIEFDTRNGPFFSTLLFVTGYLISGREVREKWLFYGIVVFLLGTVMHFAEVYSLYAMYSTGLKQDYVIGTYFMGVGVAMTSLSNHPALRNKALSKIGRMTLGIYAIHYIFVDLLRPIDKALDSIVWELGYVILVLALSVMACSMLSQNKTTKKIVV
jgi:surface polysaccharide O-acyltransferase-like enzyme